MILRKRSLATALVLAVAASGAIVAPSFAAVTAANTVTIWVGVADATKDQQTPIIKEWAKPKASQLTWFTTRAAQISLRLFQKEKAQT